MNEDLKEQEVQLRDDVYGTIDEVGAALESGEEQKQLDVGKLIPPIVTRYSELLAKADSEDERERIERGLGRIVTDLRRTASKLSQRASGNKAERAADAGGQPFLLTRAPSPFLTKSSAPTGRRRNDNALTVGGEVEAWCGKCKESRTHRIVVIHEKRPYKVQCVHCKSQHGYRSEPTARGSSETTTESPRRVVRTIDPEATKRRLEREKLSAELSAVPAESVRSFDPAGIYKSGQVLEHPKYGRGKIESITRGSLLVRFIDGLRPLSRQGWG